MNLIESIKKHEGFSKEIYLDHLGNPTVGYGFLVSALTKDEKRLNDGKEAPMDEPTASAILERKISKLRVSVAARLSWLENKPDNVRDAVLEMAYQLGLEKLMLFKKALKAFKDDDIPTACAEMRRSNWYKQTPNRVEDLIKKLKGF